MTYVKLTDDLSLEVTKADTLYRGDNMSKAITFLIPTTASEINFDSTTIFLNYIRPDGNPDIVILEKSSTMYNDNYYQYVLPVTCKLSRCSGVVRLWLQIMSGDMSVPTIAKSGECTLLIRESDSMDDYLCDHQLLAMYQLKKRVDALINNDSSTGSGGSAEDDTGGVSVVQF